MVLGLKGEIEIENSATMKVIGRRGCGYAEHSSGHKSVLSKSVIENPHFYPENPEHSRQEDEGFSSILGKGQANLAKSFVSPALDAEILVLIALKE